MYSIMPIMKQKYGVPAILSFFIPGLGQLVKTEYSKGIFFFIGVIIGYIFFILPGLILWIWNIIDAYNSQVISEPLQKPS